MPPREATGRLKRAGHTVPAYSSQPRHHLLSKLQARVAQQKRHGVESAASVSANLTAGTISSRPPRPSGGHFDTRFNSDTPWACAVRWKFPDVFLSSVLLARMISPISGSDSRLRCQFR